MLDLLGQRVDGRREREVKYLNEDESSGFRRADAPRLVIKKSQFFMVYYLGEFEGEELFCFEGNDIETYENLIANKGKISSDYYNEKYWFSLICKYSKGTFEYIRDVQKNEGEISVVPNQDQLAIILLRDKFSNQNFGYGYLKAQDEQKITIPRRNSKFETQFVFKKVEFLYEQLKKEQLKLYSAHVLLLK